MAAVDARMITARVLKLFSELERATRARRRATDCTIAATGYCTTKCRACRTWYDVHAELHSELKLPPWRWPCVPRNPWPPGSAREWRAGSEQEQLWRQLCAAAPGATHAPPV